jgi:hypothetical protein
VALRYRSPLKRDAALTLTVSAPGARQLSRILPSAQDLGARQAAQPSAMTRRRGPYACLAG